MHIAPRVTIVGMGSVTIGDYSTIAPGVIIYTSTPDLKYGTNKYASKFVAKEGDVSIGKNVFIGAGVIIPYGSNIPDNTVVAAGVIADLDMLKGIVKGANLIFKGKTIAPAEKDYIFIDDIDIREMEVEKDANSEER